MNFEVSWVPNYLNNAGFQSAVMRWPLAQLDAYLAKAFFFNPFRHSHPRLRVELTEKLAQDGSNLPQVLHTINSNNRELFSKIEEFTQASLPDVGILQTPLLSNQDTEIAFRNRKGNYIVRLENMGLSRQERYRCKGHSLRPICNGQLISGA